MTKGIKWLIISLVVLAAIGSGGNSRTIHALEPNLVSSCGGLAPGLNLLTQNIDATGRGTCFTILGSGVTLDGQGFTVKGGHFTGVHVLSTPTISTQNTVIKNLTLTNWGSKGINVQDSTLTTIENTFIWGNHHGITLERSSNNTIIDNTISNNQGSGIIATAGNNLIQDNTISDNGRGILLVSSSTNNIYSNNLIGPRLADLSADSTGNIFNLPVPDGGNYWSDWDEPGEGCDDLAPDDGFCDQPRPINAGHQDAFPWTLQQADWGVAVTPVIRDMTISKWAEEQVVGVGSRVHYSITIDNLGNSTFTEIETQDVLPPGTTFVEFDFVSDGGTCNLETDPATINCSWQDFTPGEFEHVFYSLTADAEGEIQNTATVTTTDALPDDFPADNTSTSTVTVLPVIVVDFDLLEDLSGTEDGFEFASVGASLIDDGFGDLQVSLGVGNSIQLSKQDGVSSFHVLSLDISSCDAPDEIDEPDQPCQVLIEGFGTEDDEEVFTPTEQFSPESFPVTINLSPFFDVDWLRVSNIAETSTTVFTVDNIVISAVVPTPPGGDPPGGDPPGGDPPVEDPQEAIESLAGDVEDLGLPNGLENSLISKLNAALKSLDKGNDTAAVNQLNAFINQVQAQSGKKIDTEDADALIASAQGIIDSIENGG